MFKSQKTSRYSLSFFELLFLVWAGLSLLSVALVILGIFYPGIILLYLVSAFLLIHLLIKSKKLSIKKISLTERLLLIGLILWLGLISYFTTPTIFEGRDEGSLATSALMINQDHGLFHSGKTIDTFATIYGPGRALNFPGFFYEKINSNFVLKSQFLPGYTGYLANFAFPSKINLLKLANLFPLLIFALAFYFIVKQLTRSIKFSLFATLGLVTILPVLLFYKFTLSEIFFASLIWPSLYFLIKYLQGKQSLFNFYLIFIPLLPTVFVRIESFGIIFVLILILIARSHQQLQLPKFQAIILLIILLGAISITLFSDFFILAGKGFFNHFSANANQKTTTQKLNLIPKMWQNFYILKVFYIYNLLPLFVFAFLSLKKLFQEKKWLLLTPLFFLGITLIYFLDANISLDHPWLLRRFTFSIIPLSILYTIFFFQRYPLRQKQIGQIILIVILTSNFLLSLPFLTFKQNNNLLSQTAILAEQFQNNDLILVSQKSSGSGWSLISAPLRTIFHKQAVYFFNPADYEKINKEDYDKIYLLSSKEELSHYENKLTFLDKKPYSLSTEIIFPSKNPWQLPKFQKMKTDGYILRLK